MQQYAFDPGLTSFHRSLFDRSVSQIFMSARTGLSSLQSMDSLDAMAWSFYLMDLDYELCLLAILIYRIAYYFAPIAVSIFFFKRFFPPSDLSEPGKEYKKA